MNRLAIGTVLLFVSAGASAQLVYKPPPTTTTCADRVAVTGFAVTPYNQSINPKSPLAGDVVTATMTVKNVCSSGNRNIPWRIAKNNLIIGTGTAYDVPQGATRTVTATWTAAAGAHDFYGDIDFDNTSGETSTYRQNNITQNIHADVAPFVTQKLNYALAKNASATFAHNEQITTHCHYAGQFKPGDTPHMQAQGDYSVMFLITCMATGGKADPEAFGNFQLKNGWRVKSVDPSYHNGVFEKSWNAQWQWTVRPVKGSTSPYMKMHLWANPGGEAFSRWDVWIEGPQGTDPYQ